MEGTDAETLVRVVRSERMASLLTVLKKAVSNVMVGSLLSVLELFVEVNNGEMALLPAVAAVVSTARMVLLRCAVVYLIFQVVYRE